MKGFIKLHRKIIDWQWYQNMNTSRLFLHCLLKAEYETNEIERGSFITKIQTLSDETGMSIQKIRSALKKLVLTNEITIKTTNKFTLIKVNNYDEYQQDNKQNNKQKTIKKEVVKTNESYDYMKYIDAWNEYFNPRVKIRLTDTRKQQIKIRETKNNNFYYDFNLCLEEYHKSSFLRESTWFNIDFLLANDNNYVKTLEGKYRDKIKFSERDKQYLNSIGGNVYEQING